MGKGGVPDLEPDAEPDAEPGLLPLRASSCQMPNTLRGWALRFGGGKELKRVDDEGVGETGERGLEAPLAPT